MPANSSFNLDCVQCPRLSAFLGEVRVRHPGYHAKPVAPFGARDASMLVVGLAPGLHGANRTGRPFTGDHAGLLLYATLHRYGFASQATSVSADDAQRLIDCRITNAVKCVPPENKPTPAEIKLCNHYLVAELKQRAPHVILALGNVAHGAVLRALALKPAGYKFAHGAEHQLQPALRLIDSYHCSRYNTQTGRLTSAMFEQVVARARELVDSL